MSNMGCNKKIDDALAAMNCLGIKPEVVKPVLAKLLKLYDHNWQLIEEDNYRALADAIFEYEDDTVKDSELGIDAKLSKKDMEMGSQPKRLRSGERKVLTAGKSNEDMHPVSSQRQVRESFERTPEKREQSNCCLLPRPCDREKVLTSRLTPKRKGYHGRNSEHPFHGQLHKRIERNSDHPFHGQLHKQIDRTLSTTHGGDYVRFQGKDHADKATHDITDCVGLAGESSSKSYTSSQSSACCIRNGYVNLARNGMNSEYHFVIASSSLGEVKLSVNCDVAVRRGNFRKPDFAAVMRLVEKKYLQSFNLVNPEFSMMRLLEYFCDGYLELGIYTSSSAMKEVLSARSRSDNNRCHLMTQSCMTIDFPTQHSYIKKADCARNLGIIEQKPVIQIEKRYCQRIDDIAKGSERVKINLVDDNGGRDLPKFFYIPQNTVYQNAYLHFSLARMGDEDCCPSCSGDCLSSSIPCACTHDTGGEFAYTHDGCLKEEFLSNCISMKLEPQKHHIFYCHDCPLERTYNEKREPCKGHLLRKFIKECWRKCGCDMQCGNRVVQRGISCNFLQVFFTEEGKGWGLRTLERLPIGTFVCEYVGEIVTNLELYERNQSRNKATHTYPVLLDADWGSEEILEDQEALCLDATLYGNVARFINHRCSDANLIEIPVSIETPDRHYYHVAFFAKRTINAFEELTWDYGIDFSDQNHPVKAFECRCHSIYCRDLSQRGKTLIEKRIK